MSKVTLSMLEGFPEEIKHHDEYNFDLKDADKEVVIDKTEFRDIMFDMYSPEEITLIYDVLSNNLTKLLKLK